MNGWPASPVRSFSAGLRVRLPSGREVQLCSLSGGRSVATWLCAYVEGGELVANGVGGNGRVMLRQDWLRRYGELAR